MFFSRLHRKCSNQLLTGKTVAVPFSSSLAAVMPRIPRGQVAGHAYHVLNRGNGGATVFHKNGDYTAFLTPLFLHSHASSSPTVRRIASLTASSESRKSPSAECLRSMPYKYMKPALMRSSSRQGTKTKVPASCSFTIEYAHRSAASRDMEPSRTARKIALTSFREMSIYLFPVLLRFPSNV
jgi:hypothetical protein